MSEYADAPRTGQIIPLRGGAVGAGSVTGGDVCGGAGDGSWFVGFVVGGVLAALPPLPFPPFPPSPLPPPVGAGATGACGWPPSAVVTGPAFGDGAFGDGAFCWDCAWA